MDVTLAFLFSGTLAPANLYAFSDVSLKYSHVLMTSFSNLLNYAGSLRLSRNYSTLSASDASKLKELLAEGHKVLPSYGAKDCLGMKPKENHLNGWTLSEKQT